MTALNPSPAAHRPSQARSQLATGANPRARRLSIPIAGGKPNPAGNAAAVTSTSSPRWPRQHPFRSLKRQTLNQTGSQCSERNKTIPVRVGNDADLRAGRLHSPERPVLRLLAMVALVLDRHSLPPSPSRRVPCLKVVSAKPTMARELLHGLQPKFEN